MEKIFYECLVRKNFRYFLAERDKFGESEKFFFTDSNAFSKKCKTILIGHVVVHIMLTQ